MNIKRPATVLISFMLIVSQHVLGQETMLNDFSYLYLEKLVAVAKENYPKVKAMDNKINIAKNNLSSEKAGCSNLSLSLTITVRIIMPLI